MKILGKIHKIGEDTVIPIKTKRKRRRRLTPEERQNKINRVENKVKENKSLYSRSQFNDVIEWTDEEIEQQQRELDNNYKAIKQDINKKIEIEKKKSKLFCSCKQHVIKDGYWICVECGNKKRKAGTTK